ncbi:MAG: hypothetical protein IKI37_10620, partial [Oscillospiraceae bacterium]|nr:hypothetical protein [Oscillospiraceae bacterium]
MKEKCKIISVFLTGVILLNMGVSLSEMQAKAESISAELLCDGTTISYSSEKKQEAWNEANRKKNAVLKLYEDWTIDSNLTAVSEAEFTLDLNGHILKRSLTDYQDEGHLITLEENAKLSIVDSMPDAVHENYAIKGGILTGGKSGDTAGCIELEEHSVLNLKGCSIIGCSTQQDGGAIRMDYVCELNIQDTGFYVNFTADSNDNCHGGAIYIGDGTATIQNASFEGNYSEDNAGAIYINDGGLSVSKSI